MRGILKVFPFPECSLTVSDSFHERVLNVVKLLMGINLMVHLINITNDHILHFVIDIRILREYKNII